MFKLLPRKILSTLFHFFCFFKKRRGAIVLNYHRINDVLEPNALVVNYRVFQQQMKYLYKHKDKFRVVGINGLLEYLNNPSIENKGQTPVVITFDDGFRDNYFHAYLALKEYGFPAIIFLTSGKINSNEEMLNWDEIHEMSKNNIEFGAHTVSHPHLSQISIADAEKEIADSKIQLESKNLKSGSFAYPYGDYNNEVRELVKKSCFSCAFTVKPGINKAGDDLFELKRTGINGNDTVFDFKKKLSGAYDPLHKFVQRHNTQYTIHNTNNRINILYLIWSLGLGGAERVVISLAKNLDKEKFNPIICCLNDKGVFADELEKEGIKVIALHKNGKFDITIIKKIIGVIKQYDINIIHTHLWGANLWGRIAAKLSGVKTVITEHNIDEWKTPLHFLIDRWLFSKTDCFIAVSETVKEFYARKIGISKEKMKVVYNGIGINSQLALPTSRQAISKSQKTTLREEFGIKDNEKVIALIGRLVPQKGHDFFLRAISGMNLDAKVLIVGDGPLKQSLKLKVKSENIEDKIIFTGFRKDVQEILKITDVLVLPSSREGLPMIILEAMGAGAVVVATRVGGTPELVEDGVNGFLVEYGDVAGLSKKIDDALKPEAALYVDKIRMNARKTIEERFSLKKMTKEHERLYSELSATETPADNCCASMRPN